ncbi:MAG TPA: DNA primase [Solirubrobacterales bacterium]|nr:DNA primase [Solirubrobacterales bacterium]
MSTFTRDSVERVKDAADIVEVVSAHTDLRRSGARYTGRCPFHDERTPSFSVDPAAKLYHCFGCGVGGDVIRFVEEKEGLPFQDAVEALADRFGVELEREREDPAAEQARKRHARLGELLERTAAFYAGYLWESPDAAKAREYLAGRGLGEEVLREFGVGLAPGRWDTVLVRGQRAGYSIEELEASGLVQPSRKRDGHYDRFRSRIVFPVRDARGRVQGFGARALRPDQRPKYVNSPESEIYRKRRTLFGIDRARAEITKTGRALVVEGYTDVLGCHQAGLGEAVAVMGTAITPEQVRTLAAYTDQVVLALDADRSGREAMLRAQAVAEGKRVRLRVARMPDGEDPADLLTAGGEHERRAAAGRFREAIEAAEELPVFHVRTLLAGADKSSPAGRDRALDEVVPVIAAMPESITRDELLREVADGLDADPGLVARRVAAGGWRRAGAGTAANEAGGASASPMPRLAATPAGGGEAGGRGATAQMSVRERREEALLAMCAALPAYGRGFLDRLTGEHFSSPVAARARDWLEAHLDDPTAGLSREDDEELWAYVTRVVMRADREPASPEAMEWNYLWLERALVDDRIAAVERKGDGMPVELQRRRGELTERIAHFESHR